MGQAKAALIVDGATLAERTAALLATVAGPVIEVGPGYTSLVRAQESPAGSGPLAAVGAGWTALQAGPATPPAVLVVATDLPRLNARLLAWLVRHPGERTVVPLDAEGNRQPLCARYSPADLATAVELVAAGHRSMSALLDRIDVSYARPEEDGALRDIDTPDDLAGMTGHE